MTPVKLFNALVGSQVPVDTELFYGFAIVGEEVRVYLRNSNNRRWIRRPTVITNDDDWDEVHNQFKGFIISKYKDFPSINWVVSSFRIADDRTIAVAKVFRRK